MVAGHGRVVVAQRDADDAGPLLPHAAVRLSAGRQEMTEEAQALCFMGGVNSIFVGDALLTTPNPEPTSDAALLARVGLRPLADGSR